MNNGQWLMMMVNDDGENKCDEKLFNCRAQPQNLELIFGKFDDAVCGF